MIDRNLLLEELTQAERIAYNPWLNAFILNYGGVMFQMFSPAGKLLAVWNVDSDDARTLPPSIISRELREASEWKTPGEACGWLFEWDEKYWSRKAEVTKAILEGDGIVYADDLIYRRMDYHPPIHFGGKR